MIDQGMLASWVDVGLFIVFTFILSEWINWSIALDKKKPHFADRDVGLKFLDLMHRATLQTVHDLIYRCILWGRIIYFSSHTWSPSPLDHTIIPTLLYGDGRIYDIQLVSGSRIYVLFIAIHPRIRKNRAIC